MNELLEHELFEFGLELAAPDLVDLKHRPRDELRHLGPPVLRSLTVKYDNDELEVFLGDTGGETGPGCRGDSSLQPRVAGLEELVCVLPVVDVVARLLTTGEES